MATVIIRLGKLTRKVGAAELTTESAASLAEELADEPPGPVTIEVKCLADLPQESQEALWLLYRAAKQQRDVKLFRKKKVYAQPLELVLAQLIGDEDPALCERRLLAATTAVAACYSPPAHTLCIEKLHKKLKGLGVTGFTPAKLMKLVEGGSQPGGSQGPIVGGNPTLLAADFLQRYREGLASDSLSGNARILHYHNATWYYWDLVWREVVPDEMRSLVTKNLQDHSGVAAVTTRLVGNVLENLRGLCLVGQGKEPLPFYIDDYTPPTAISSRHLLVLQNGMLDLDDLANGEDPELLDFDPCWFGTSVLPFEYDPGAKCPQFKQFLYQVLERNPEDGKALHKGDKRLRVLQEWFGYTLLCDGRFQKFLLMVGEGSNGKGVIQNLWIKMLGNGNVSHVSLDQLSGEFALQPLLGKMANICGDLCEIDAVAEGVLKRLTGQDNLTVNRKNQPMLSMAPAVKLVFATNTLPRFQDKSRGVWRRLIAMPFRVVIPEDQQDETLAQELEEELPGIFNWALRGLKRLLEQGHFTHCEVCAKAAARHRTACNPVAQFFDERVLLPAPKPGQVHRIRKDELYTGYKEWCEAGGYKPYAKNRFGEEVLKLPGVGEWRQGNAEPDGSRPWYWTGIGKPVPLPASDDDDVHDDEGS